MRKKKSYHEKLKKKNRGQPTQGCREVDAEEHVKAKHIKTKVAVQERSLAPQLNR